MGSLIFKILSLKTITDNQVLEDKLSSLTSSMEGLVLFLSSVTGLHSFDELKCRVDNQIDDTVLHVQTSEPQSKKVSDFLSLKERVASGVNSENKEELCSLFVAILSLYSENVIPAEVNQSMVLMIEKIQNSDSHYFKDTSYVQLFKTFSLMLLSAYFSKSNCVLPALSIYPLGANLQCRDGGNVEIELATTKLSNHPAQQYIEGFIEMFIAKESLLQSVPWQMHKHVPMGIRILLGGDKKAISKIDRYALGAMTYVSAGSMVDVFKSFRHVFRDSIEDVSSLLRKKTFTVDDRKQIEESLIFCDADSESLTGCFFSPLTDEDSMPIFGESDVSNVGPFFRDSGLAYIQDLYVANSEDFEVVDRLLVSSLETWSYVTCDENGRLTISSHNMWGKLSGDAPCEHLTEGQTNRLFNVILPNFYQYERSENYLSNVEQSIQSSVYSKNKETIPRRFSLDDYHDFFDPTKTDLLIDQVSQCLVDFSIGLDVNLECVSDALFLLNVVSETCRDSSYIIASDIFQHVTVDVLLNIEERVSGNPYLLNRLSQVKDRYAVVTQHAGLQIYRQYLNGTIDLSKQEEINTLGTAYIRFNAPYSRMDRYLEKVVDHLMCSRTCIIDKVLSADFSDNENLFFFMNPMTVKTLLLRKTNQEKAKFLFFKNRDNVLSITQIKYKDRAIYDDYIGSAGFLSSLTNTQLYHLFRLEAENTLFLNALFSMGQKRLISFLEKPVVPLYAPLYLAVNKHNVKFFDRLLSEETIDKIGPETVSTLLTDSVCFSGNGRNSSCPSIYDYSVRCKFYDLFHLLLQPNVVKHVDVLVFYENLKNQACLPAMMDDQRDKFFQGLFSKSMVSRYGIDRIVDLFLKSPMMMDELFRETNDGQCVGVNCLFESGMIDSVDTEKIRQLFL